MTQPSLSFEQKVRAFVGNCEPGVQVCLQMAHDQEAFDILASFDGVTGPDIHVVWAGAFDGEITDMISVIRACHNAEHGLTWAKLVFAAEGGVKCTGDPAETAGLIEQDQRGFFDRPLGD